MGGPVYGPVPLATLWSGWAVTSALVLYCGVLGRSPSYCLTSGNEPVPFKIVTSVSGAASPPKWTVVLMVRYRGVFWEALFFLESKLDHGLGQ